MKQLVILGLGARSTLFYQSTLHKLSFNKEGAYATFPFILKQLDFNAINPYLPNNAAIISPILYRELRDYNTSAVNLLVPNITIHEILDTMQFELHIIHPYKLLVNELATKAISNLVFFGTKHADSSSSIASYLSDQSIVKLRHDEVLFLDDLRKKVYANTETNQDIKIFKTLVAKYSKTNIVIIACTELSIINTNNRERVIDLALLQCHKSLELINY